ncbi:MAG TPA: excinuclease ABC subunit UvrA [Vicinamibacterales bacterium]|jgi:excinuclease ABC subunit A|nr:excinuclease ABC subunit UvrA [Vicinamibacterales bacterium]
MSKPRASRNGHIVIRGARTHNLQNVDLTLPTGKLIIVTGVSGSGKSSLAFDTIYAEGQRRYVESLSAYARQFLERMEKPDVDEIDGICPAIAIRQKNSLRNPRSTVGTTTEIHDYLRLFFARVGRTVCRKCGQQVIRESAEVAAQQLLALPAGTRLLLGFTFPVVPRTDGGKPENNERDAADATEARKTTSDEPAPATNGGQETPVEAAIATLRRKGFGRLIVTDQDGRDGRAVNFDDVDPSALADCASLQVVVDRLKVGPDLLGRVTDSVETAYLEGGGSAFAMEVGGESTEPPVVHRFSERFECRQCSIVYEVPQPRLFSFNSPFGACPTCHGFGNIIELDLNLAVPDQGKSIQQNAVEPFSKPHYRSHLVDLKRAARARGVRLTTPWRDLTDEEREFVVEGDGDGYKGIKGFFRWLERKKYKVHVRVFLSRYRGYLTCPECDGTRLRREARDVYVGGRTVDSVCGLTIGAAAAFFDDLTLTEKEHAVAERVVREITRRLLFLRDVGLEYLTLDRLSSTLSGGEAQRINLATALGSALVGTLYVLDEPSIGLHPRDNERLITILRQLRDQGNTVLVVEHDADTIRVGDMVVDLGLGAGEQGGRIIFAGTFEALLKEPQSLTAKYMRGDLQIPLPASRRKHPPLAIRVTGARQHNLKEIDVDIPLNTLTCVTGVSGSGKSTLVHDVIYAAIKRAKGSWDRPVGAHDEVDGSELVTDVTLVDQAPIGRTPRSNPVTYLKAFDPIRELFSKTKDARANALTASHFSFNVPGGRCDGCDGEGVMRVEMQFLADVFVPCDECDGRRFKPQVLDVLYRGCNVAEVLDMTVREALSFFSASPKVVRRLRVLDEIGLGYLRLGQPATTLSGGEAQRIKIASHLSSRKTDRTLYILDEPTTGLHFDDIAKLLAAFRKLLQAGNSLLVIEHNLDVIKTADWIIDLGPEGGEAGGHIVAEGTPEQIAMAEDSVTGRYLRPILTGGRAHAYADVRA